MVLPGRSLTVKKYFAYFSFLEILSCNPINLWLELNSSIWTWIVLSEQGSKISIIWVYDDSKYCDGSGVDDQNFDLKELLLTIVFTWTYQMKIFEKLFELFLIFAQFIQIDAIVGGYESEPHRNALI